MPAKLITKRIKTSREVTDSELINFLKNAMGPIFSHFEEKIAEAGSKVLHIEVTAQPGKLNLIYGFSDVQQPNVETAKA
jgi:hypothetical protein